MVEESDIKPAFLKVDGGASMNNFLMQFQSDMLDLEITRPKVAESTALGAAYISGLSTKFFDSIEELQALSKKDKTFVPHMDKEQRDSLYKNWKSAVNATIKFK
jgi:glycerol kinase